MWAALKDETLLLYREKSSTVSITSTLGDGLFCDALMDHDGQVQTERNYLRDMLTLLLS